MRTPVVDWCGRTPSHILASYRAWVAAAATLIIAGATSAQEFDWSFHGFGQANHSAGFSSAPGGGDFRWAEVRWQSRLDVSMDGIRAYGKADAFFDHLDRDGDLELREGFLDYSAGLWEVRAGRQVLTWGLGDLLFINDVFPKDYSAFFSGRPLEYLKKGVDGIRIGLYPEFVSVEFLAIPFFEPNTFPRPDRFWMFDPFTGITDRSTVEPDESLRNTEYALRLYREMWGFDGSVYFYDGFFRQPSIMPGMPIAPSLTMFYPQVTVYGASLQGSGFDGVLSFEAGVYDSRLDRGGDNSLLPNSQTRFLVGYQRQMWEDHTLSIQYYGELMHDYDAYTAHLPPEFPPEDEVRHLTALRFTQFLVNQTLRLSLFTFYSPSDGDYLAVPEVKYNFTDNIWGALGANIFGGGNAWSPFGQFGRNDNLYAQFRYEY